MIEGVVARSSAVVPICYLPSYHWTPGLFNVRDFVPPKGGLRWRHEDVSAPQ